VGDLHDAAQALRPGSQVVVSGRFTDIVHDGEVLMRHSGPWAARHLIADIEHVLQMRPLVRSGVVTRHCDV
jgi:hypothetical protein